MTGTFLPADVGRDIVFGGGLATITGYIDASNVTVEVKQAFPSTIADTGAWSLLGTPLTTCTPGAKDPVGATTTLTLSNSGWRDEDVGRFVRINGGLCRITGKTSATVVSAVIEKELTSVVAAPPYAWTLEGAMWGGPWGYPRCGTLFEQRLWAAGSPGFPQMIWGSVIGVPRDFTLGTEDDEALAYTIAAGQSATILHLAAARGLVVLTSASEHSARGGQDRAITPTNIKVEHQSSLGSSFVAPVRVGGELFFAQRSRRKVRALSPSQFDSEQYLAPDMAVLAEHVTESGIVAMDYQAEPDPLLYAVREDGQLATMTHDRDQEVFAWTRQVTQGNFEDVAVVPTSTGNRVFAVVARVVNGVTTRYIETFEAGLHTDSAITGHSDAGATVWGGLSHLEGRTVQAKGDGIYLGEFVVQGGQVTLPRAARDVEIGLQYITAVKTLTPEFMSPSGSAQGTQLSVHESQARFLNTIGATINLQEVAFRRFGLGVLDKPPRPFSGDKSVGAIGWDKARAQTLIQQTLPYDFHLLSVITHLTSNEG